MGTATLRKRQDLGICLPFTTMMAQPILGQYQLILELYKQRYQMNGVRVKLLKQVKDKRFEARSSVIYFRNLSP